MPVLLDKAYLEWMKPTTGSDPVCAIKTTNTISSHPSSVAAYLETHQGEELPEDVYFEKSVDAPVAIHYACGMPFRPGYIHHAFKRCQPPNPFKRYNNSESSSSTISITGGSSETSPTSPRPPFASGARPPSKFPEKRVRPLSPRAAGWPFAPPQAQPQQHCSSPPNIQSFPSPAPSVCSISGAAEVGSGEPGCQHCAYAKRYTKWLHPQTYHERRDSGIGCTPDLSGQLSTPGPPLFSLPSPPLSRAPSFACHYHQQNNLPYRPRQDSQDQYSSDYQQLPSRRRWSQATNSTVTSIRHHPSASAAVPDQLEDFFYEMGSDGRQAVFYGTGNGMHKGKEVRNARTCGNWRDS
ncbi:uncharacterized protein J3D65DRAFT_637699 [Phyllosticta citribraziliensis]|uniref:Uncharacterized protein n=1 Tax=Phyllosticta citribraziliensis TaxID=989973 RepID=A0ABR1L886_9PEZI